MARLRVQVVVVGRGGRRDKPVRVHMAIVSVEDWRVSAFVRAAWLCISGVEKKKK